MNSPASRSFDAHNNITKKVGAGKTYTFTYDTSKKTRLKSMTDNGEVQYFSYDAINSYTFTSPSIWMQGQPMAVPCHFLDLSDEIARMQPGEVFELRENKKYHTENTASDFYEFYRTIGAYQCEERDDGVTVSYTDKDENQTTMLVLVEQEQEGMSVAFQSVM